MDNNDIVNRFRFHPAKSPSVAEQHDWVRKACLDLALELNQRLPESREKSLAVTHLEEVMFWSNAAVARNGE